MAYSSLFSLCFSVVIAAQFGGMALQGEANGIEPLNNRMVTEHNQQLRSIISRTQPSEEKLNEIKEKYLPYEELDLDPYSFLRSNRFKPSTIKLSLLDPENAQEKNQEKTKKPFTCKKQWEEHPEKRPKIRLFYERHDNANAKANRKEMIELAKDKKSVLLLESDFSNAFREADEIFQPVYSYENGLARTMTTHGVRTSVGKVPETILGLDHALFRALSSTMLWKEDHESDNMRIAFMEELLRNDFLRVSFYSASTDSQLSSDGRSLASCLKAMLNQLAGKTDLKLDSSWICKNEKGEFKKLLQRIENDLKLRHPLLSKLAFETPAFQLRDAAMAVSTVDAVCKAMQMDIKEVHVSIGYLHLDGVKTHLRSFLGSKAPISEYNATDANVLAQIESREGQQRPNPAFSVQ